MIGKDKTTFNLVFDKKYFSKGDILPKKQYWKHIKEKILHFLKIYRIYRSQVLSEPKQTKEDYCYDIKLIGYTQYFFGIKLYYKIIK